MSNASGGVGGEENSKNVLSRPSHSDDHNLTGLHLLESMFHYSRLAPSNSARDYCSRLLLLLYLPLGLLLVPLRLFCMVIAGLVATFQCSSCCLPRKLHTLLLRIELLVFFGVWISVKGGPAADSPIWVANHISEFDAVVLRAISDPYILGYHFYRDLWWLKLSPLRLFKMIYVPQQSRSEGNTSGRDEMNRLIKDTLKQPQQVLLLFPEGGLTNGRKGLMQYHKFVFGLGLAVQPIALSLWSPLPLHVDTMYATFLNNVLAFLFVPCQSYSIDFLHPVSLDVEKQESPLDFARRVMALTAKHLNIQASPFLYSDKKKWGKLRRTLTKEGYRFNIVVDELNNSVSVVNIASQNKKKTYTKASRIQPVVTLSREEGGGDMVVERQQQQQHEEQVPVSSDESGATDRDRDRAVLLNRLYDAWQMTQEGFSHLAFAPVASSGPGPDSAVQTTTCAAGAAGCTEGDQS